MNEKNKVKMIRLPLQLYGLILFQKRYVQPNWSKMASKFLQLTNHHIRVEVTGKTVNHGVELGLKIPVKLFFVEMQEL